MWTFSWTWRLVHNLVFIKPNYNLDNLDYFGLWALTLTIFLISLGGFSHASLLELLNPNNLKHNLHYMYDHVYIIYAFVKKLDEPPVLIYLSGHPGSTCNQLDLETLGSRPDFAPTISPGHWYRHGTMAYLPPARHPIHGTTDDRSFVVGKRHHVTLDASHGHCKQASTPWD